MITYPKTDQLHVVIFKKETFQHRETNSLEERTLEKIATGGNLAVYNCMNLANFEYIHLFPPF